MAWKKIDDYNSGDTGTPFQPYSSFLAQGLTKNARSYPQELTRGACLSWRRDAPVKWASYGTFAGTVFWVNCGANATEITFRLPGLRWEHVTVGDKQVLALSAMTPINAHKTRMNQIMWSDHWAFTAFYPIIRIAARAFHALSEKGVNIRAITTSEIKFSVLIDEAYTELAVRTLHTLYGLDAA